MAKNLQLFVKGMEIGNKTHSYEGAHQSTNKNDP
jgi:hypothetical protein